MFEGIRHDSMGGNKGWMDAGSGRPAGANGTPNK
jgi:hypothetical protein